MSSEPELTIELQALESYRLGFPMLVAVVLRNPSAARTYFTLPPIRRLVMPPPVELTLTPAGHDPVTLPASAPAAIEGPARGLRLGPKQSHRVLIDVSELEPPAVPGPAELSARYIMRPFTPRSPAISITRVEPPPDEAAAVDRLRRTNASGRGSWNAFLMENFREVEADELYDLTPEGRTSLALHLWMHRAIYGATPLERLDLDPLDALDEEPLTAEAEVLRHELLLARQDPGADDVANEIEAQWPGLTWRLDRNRDGRGMLTTLRSMVGANRTTPPPPSVLPYAGAGSP